MSKEIASALRDTLISPNVCDSNLESANVVDALDDGLGRIARALRLLGNADASTPLGALEAHGQCILTASETIAGAIRELAEAIGGIRSSEDPS